MKNRQQEIRELKANEHPSQFRLAELRSSGMHAIRFEFVVRLLRAMLREDTVSIFWDHESASLREKPLGEGTWLLVLGRGKRVSAEFPDLWVLCYPDDPETRPLVESALDRMVEKVRAQTALDPRTRDLRPQLPRATPGGRLAQGPERTA